MTMRITVHPTDFACELWECPPGLFLSGDDCLGFKTEYGEMEVFVVESGEVFWGGGKTEEERRHLMVIPCEYRIEK